MNYEQHQSLYPRNLTRGFYPLEELIHLYFSNRNIKTAFLSIIWRLLTKITFNNVNDPLIMLRYDLRLVRELESGVCVGPFVECPKIITSVVIKTMSFKKKKK